MDSAALKPYFTGLQDRIVASLEKFDGGQFKRDAWTRPAGGGGVTRVIEEGDFFERGGVAFSHVMGEGMPPSATAHRPELAGRRFEALGVSLVLHPRNPYCPTVHMNVRSFVAMKEGAEPVWWFGGGMDLTPYYGFEDDARHFHGVCRATLAPFGAEVHPRYKKWCDEYFFLRHRNEARGVGGVFDLQLEVLRPSDVKLAHNKIVAQCRADGSPVSLSEVVQQLDGLAKTAGQTVISLVIL